MEKHGAECSTLWWTLKARYNDDNVKIAAGGQSEVILPLGFVSALASYITILQNDRKVHETDGRG